MKMSGKVFQIFMKDVPSLRSCRFLSLDYTDKEEDLIRPFDYEYQKNISISST